MAGFGTFAPNSNASAGLGLLKQVSALQNPRQPGGAAPGPGGGLIERLMSGNPGGLIGALMGPQNAPVNPGAPPAAGSPAYVPGGAGPAMGGPAAGGGMPPMGLLAKMFPQMAAGGGAPPMQPMQPMAPPMDMPAVGGLNGW